MTMEALHAYRREETGISGELLGRQNVGLQARLLTGNFSDPLLLTREQLHEISEHGADGISHEVGRLYENASRKQRREYQQATNLTYKSWRTKFDSYLQGIRGDTEHGERKAFLETIGIADHVTASDFYDEYLQDGSQVVKFVKDIEAVASIDQIQKHADIIRALGNTFGFATSAVIEHLIHGVRNVKDNTDKFIETASGAANVPRTLEHSLLRIIREDGEDGAEARVPLRRGTRRHRIRRAEHDEERAGSSGGRRRPMPVVDFPSAPAAGAQTTAADENYERPPMGEATPVKPVVFQEPEVQRDDLDLEEQRIAPLRRRQHVTSPHSSVLSPAPLREPQTADDADSLSDQETRLAMRYLSYNDINPPPDETPSDNFVQSKLAKEYIREFVAMTEEYGKPLVLEAAIDAAQLVGELLGRLKLDRPPVSQSPSWYLWHAAVSRFLANHPDTQATLRHADRYDPFDPLLHHKQGASHEEVTRSKQANDAIIDRMLGWEIYRQRAERKKVFKHIDRHRIPARERLQELLEQDPKDDGTNMLSSYQLIEIGNIVRTNIT